MHIVFYYVLYLEVIIGLYNECRKVGCRLCKNTAQAYFNFNNWNTIIEINLIINILKSALAENDFVNHSLNQIFRRIFADAKVENRILIRKFIFQCSMVL